jgi:hypothetical protein
MYSEREECQNESKQWEGKSKRVGEKDFSKQETSEGKIRNQAEC